jgi:tRNA1(Val) A37 N6-methylase TrmN6
MEDDEVLCLPEELYDFETERRVFKLERGIQVELECAPEHLQMSDRCAYLVVWPASITMANLLINWISQPTHETPLNILELGSGVGLCGLALAQLPADKVSQVVLSDADDAVLERLHQHVEQSTGSAKSERLFWGDSKDIEHVLSKYGSRDEGGFDMVVGTDVTYCSDYIESLIQTAAVCLKPGGSLFLAYSMPRFAQMEGQVFEMAAKYGLKFTREHDSKEERTKVIECIKI